MAAYTMGYAKGSAKKKSIVPGLESTIRNSLRITRAIFSSQ